MTKLSTTKFGRCWLARFDDAERDVAATLIDEVLLVSRDELSRGIYCLLDQVIAKRVSSARPIALFAERKIEKTWDVDEIERVLPLYPGTEHGRAIGLGAPPIVVDPGDQEIGSEGPVGNLITSYCRLHAPMALSHPGPDDMRAKHVGRIVIVTDFIGSGKRVLEMLEAFRAVATLRSWYSYGLIEFHVLAYSGTEIGLQLVRHSRLTPTVTTVAGCPTVHHAFSGRQLAAVQKLCRRYPKRHRSPLGFGGSGALIAFAHGMPNNAPPLLHSSFRGWRPLFRGRSTIGADMAFPADATEIIADRMARLLPIREARKYLDDPLGRRWITTMIVLAAIEVGAYASSKISSRSGLGLAEVEEILSSTRMAQWIGSRNRLTALGRQELARLRHRRKRKPALPSSESPFYYPTQLRAR